MIDVKGAAVRRAAEVLGFPPGTGELINQPTRRRLVVSLAGSVILSVLDMLGVLAMLPLLQFVARTPRDSGALGVVNRVLGEPSDQALLGAVASLVIVCFVGKDVFALLFRRWQLRFMAHQEIALSVLMLEHYLNGPYFWQLSKNTGDKVWTINAAVGIGYSGGLSSAMAAITQMLTIVFIVSSLAFVSPVITIAAVLYFGLAAFIIQRFIRPRVLAASEALRDAGQRTSTVSMQALTSGKEIKLRDAAHIFVQDYSAAKRRVADASARAGFLSEVPKYVIEMLFVVGIGLLAIGVTSRNADDSLILLGVFAAAGTRIMPAAVGLLSAVNGLRFAREPLRHVIRERRLLDLAHKDEASRVVTGEVPAGLIEITNVHFAYPGRPDQPVLNGVDLTLPIGKSIALVGSSGAGKSTLVDLLLGLLAPDEGTIKAGGVDIHANLPAWQRGVAVVPQDVVLFDDTLSANIAFELSIEDERMEDVIALAQLADVVADLPDGLDTRVGERGGRVSGGQRQRVGVARALYRDPHYLFLDEATSALDNETERKLTETIESLHGRMTVIIVAHRLSTVRHCDQVVFMSEGRVATSGTFDEVLAANAEFARLVELGRLTGPAT